VHTACKPHLPIPLQVGDYINYVGMLDADSAGYFISLHGLEAELGVYTSPGVDPAYIFIEEALQGTKGVLYPGIPQEETLRYKIVGFTTDPSRTIAVEIFDDANLKEVLPKDKAARIVANRPQTTNVLANKIIPLNGAQMGRFKMLWPAKDQARIVRRNVRVKLSDGVTAAPGLVHDTVKPGEPSSQLGASLPLGASVRGAYAFGQFEAPVNEYISPENTRYGVMGWPLPVNFEDFCFLRNINSVTTQEPHPTIATEYVTIHAEPVSPDPKNPVRKSQQLANGTRLCGEP
jgi:hypothetical protein